MGHETIPIGSMYAIYGNIYHQYTPNVSIYTIHGSYGIYMDILKYGRSSKKTECLVDQTWSNMVQPDQQISCATASGQEFQQREVHMVWEIASKFTPKPSDSGTTWYNYPEVS